MPGGAVAGRRRRRRASVALLCIGAGALASMRPARTVVDRCGAPARRGTRPRSPPRPAPGAGDVHGGPVRRPARPGRDVGRGRRGDQRRGRAHRGRHGPPGAEPRSRHLLGLRGGRQPRRGRAAGRGRRAGDRARRSSASSSSATAARPAARARRRRRLRAAARAVAAPRAAPAPRPRRALRAGLLRRERVAGLRRRPPRVRPRRLPPPSARFAPALFAAARASSRPRQARASPPRERADPAPGESRLGARRRACSARSGPPQASRSSASSPPHQHLDHRAIATSRSPVAGADEALALRRGTIIDTIASSTSSSAPPQSGLLTSATALWTRPRRCGRRGHAAVAVLAPLGTPTRGPGSRRKQTAQPLQRRAVPAEQEPDMIPLWRQWDLV